MRPFPAARHLLLPTLLSALGALGCVNPPPPDTTKTPIYLYDQTSQSVLVWDDVNAIADVASGGAAPAPTRTITSSLFATTSMGVLAWGGMVLNTYTNELFLVSETGNVVRVEKAATQNGDLEQVLDIATFTLGNPSTDRLASSIFSQCAVDTSTGNLYACETGSNAACRMWLVSSPNSIYNLGEAPPGTYVQVSTQDDTGGFGATVGSSGSIIGYFVGGAYVLDINNIATGGEDTGARLRTTTGTSFDATDNVLVGTQTLLGDSTTLYGALAYDADYNNIYVARPISGGYAVEFFGQGEFTAGAINSAPAGALPDLSSDLPNLRTIAHARTKDWLAGIDVLPGTVTTTSSGTGTNILRLWKAPSLLPTSTHYTLGSGTAIRGVALDGSQ